MLSSEVSSRWIKLHGARRNLDSQRSDVDVAETNIVAEFLYWFRWLRRLLLDSLRRRAVPAPRPMMAPLQIWIRRRLFELLRRVDRLGCASWPLALELPLLWLESWLKALRLLARLLFGIGELRVRDALQLPIFRPRSPGSRLETTTLLAPLQSSL